MNKQQSEVCKHPPVRLFSWFAANPHTGKKDLLCIACCKCGQVLKGGAT